ncbi:CHY zinc finger protein [Halobellus litoreus]|uniref:CHY zinc finger protein n=1 Tax=Halobellus litoreus TaxID=755310 RepID=A0ABD6DTC5_9EURY|nr:CHY zinc finger protein [Halobellus litoreus]
MDDDPARRRRDVDDPPSTGDDESRGRRTTHAPAVDDRFAVPLRGVAVDAETRCAHWDDDVDIVALRFGCCEKFSPCHACHVETADHDPEPWARERFDEPAVLCGVCGTTLSARTYLNGEDACPSCGAAFNPGCRRHRDRYFERW